MENQHGFSFTFKRIPRQILTNLFTYPLNKRSWLSQYFAFPTSVSISSALKVLYQRSLNTIANRLYYNFNQGEIKELGAYNALFAQSWGKKKASGHFGPCRAKVMTKRRHEGTEVLREDESWWERGKQTINTPRRRLEENRARWAMARHQRKDPWPPASEAALVHFLSPPGAVQITISAPGFLLSVPHDIPSLNPPSHPIHPTCLSLCPCLQENECYTFIKRYLFSLALA